MVFILTLLSFYNAAFLLHLYPQQAFGLKEGAPIKSCFHMQPKHPKTDNINDIWDAQTGPSPYAINIQFPTLAKDQKQLIFLTGLAPTKLFRGFLAEVREASDNATQPVGYFSSCPENTQPVKCANLIGAQDNVFAVTHTYGFQSNAVELEWVPPSSGGSFKVYTTFVENKRTFWLMQKSDTFTAEAGSSRPTEVKCVQNAKKSMSIRIKSLSPSFWTILMSTFISYKYL